EASEALEQRPDAPQPIIRNGRERPRDKPHLLVLDADLPRRRRSLLGAEIGDAILNPGEWGLFGLQRPAVHRHGGNLSAAFRARYGFYRGPQSFIVSIGLRRRPPAARRRLSSRSPRAVGVGPGSRPDDHGGAGGRSDLPLARDPAPPELAALEPAAGVAVASL